MTLKRKIEIADEMVIKNPDSTVQDFADAINEIEGIEMFACEPMPAAENLRAIKKVIFKPEFRLQSR